MSRRGRAYRFGAILLLLLAGAGPPRAERRPLFGPPLPPTPYDLCEAAVDSARTRAIPPTLLGAIARVESGRLDPAPGRVRPWPWTINVEGLGTFFDTKAEAIATVQALQAKGVRSIDVGCMQVNLFFHPTAFATLEEAFEPEANARYAARFLTALYGQTKDWSLATALYHSQTQERGEDYQRRVFGRVMTPMGPPLPAPAAKPAVGPYAAFLPRADQFGALPPQGASAAFGAFAMPVEAQVTPSPAKAGRPRGR